MIGPIGWKPAPLVVVDEDHLPARPHGVEHVVDDPVLVVVGHLVQQEEAAHTVVLAVEGAGRIGVNDRGVPVTGELHAGAGHLDRRDVANLEPPRRSHALGELGAQAAVDMGRLQQVLALGKFVDRRIHQPVCISPQDGLDDDLAVKQGNEARIDVGPIIDLPHVIGNGRGCYCCRCASQSADRIRSIFENFRHSELSSGRAAGATCGVRVSSSRRHGSSQNVTFPSRARCRAPHDCGSGLSMRVKVDCP